MAAARWLAAAAAAAFVLHAAVAHFAPPPGGVYSTAPGYSTGYGGQPCVCNAPCSCAPTYGGGGYAAAGWAPRAPSWRAAYGGQWAPPSVVAGDAYAVAPPLSARGGYLGPGPVIGPQYVNGGANGGAYVNSPLGGPRTVVGGFDSIRGPVGGTYARPGDYALSGRVGPNYATPFGGRGGLGGRGGAYVRGGGADRYSGAPDEGPMATVKVLLPDGSTRSISIPARFLLNTVDEYAAGGANKYTGGPRIPADPFGPGLGGPGGKYLTDPIGPSLSGPGKYLSEPVAAAIPDPAAAAAAAAATAAAEAAVNALPPAGTAAAEAAAAALSPVVPQPIEAYRAGKDDPIGVDDRRLSNYQALLLPQQDNPAVAAQALQPSNGEIDRVLDETREQSVVLDARSRNLEDYIVLRKDDPRAIYLRDHLLQLEQQAAKDAAAAAAAASTTVAPSHDPNEVGDLVGVRVSTATPFSHDEQPRILKGIKADLPTPHKTREEIIAEFIAEQQQKDAKPAPLKKEDVIAEFLEQQQHEATERAEEKAAEAEQAKIRKQLIEKQLARHRASESAAAAAAADAATESQQEVTQDELPPGWQIGIRIPTDDDGNPILEEQQEPEKPKQSDPRAHFDREPIDVRAPRPAFRGTLIDDPRLADFRPISREVAPSAIARESKSVVPAVPEFPEFGIR